MRKLLLVALLLLLLPLGPLQAQDVVAAQVNDGESQTEPLADVQAPGPDVVGGDVVLAAIAVDGEAPVVPGPSEGLEIGPAIQGLLDATKSGGTLPIVSAAIFLLLAVFRWPVAKAALNRFLPTRWLSVVAVALGVLWAVLTQVEGIGWWGAICDGLLAGGGAVAIYEVFFRAIAHKDKT